MDPPGVNRAATMASAVKASGTHATAAAAPPTGIGIIGNERGGEKNEGRNESEKMAKHDVSSLDIGIAVMRLSTCLANCVRHPIWRCERRSHSLEKSDRRP
jgi:hypothetical protein